MEALDSLYLGRRSPGSRLQLRPADRSKGRRSTSRPGTAQQHQPPVESIDAGIPRASSVPLLWDNNVNLEVHSTPVSLTTRSLSNRRATSLHGNSVHSVQQRPSSMSSGRDKRHRGLQTASHSAAIGRSLHTRSGRRSRDGDLTSVRVGAGESSSHCKPKSGRASRRSLMAAQFSGGGSVRSDAAECSVDSGRPPHSGTVTRPDQPVAEEQKWSERQTTGQGAGVVVSGSFGQRTNESAPVNQQILKSKNTSHGDEVVRRIRVGEVEAGGGEGEVEAAVRKLQRWYRGCKERQRAHMAEVRSLLRVKREELDRSRSEQQERLQAEEASRERGEEERRQRRQEKMRAARQEAIHSLHQKREEKRREGEKVAQEEIAFLQTSGKIKRPGDKRKRRRKKEEAGREGKGTERDSSSPSPLQPGAAQPAADTAAQTVPDSIIDDFFEAGSSRKTAPEGSSLAPQKSSASPSPRPTHTAPLPKAASTYSDILDTLKLLEEAPPPLPGSKSEEALPTRQGTKSGNNYLEPSSSSSARYLSPANLGRLNEVGGVRGGATQTSNSSLSESKLQSILSYLDEMERADGELVSQLSRARSQDRAGLPAAGTGTGDKGTGAQEGGGLSAGLETATAVATDVTATILAQRMELDNKNKTVEMLQKALSQQRELTVYHAQEMEKEGQRRQQLQREEYEITIKRHQCFIDQLIEDKKSLSERCERLVRDLKETSTKYQTKVKTMEEAHAAELSKVRQVAAAADKLRREKWRAEESRRIKEATVRSLEPEIQRIIVKGKADIQRLKALHEAELLQADERAGRRFVGQMEELRAQCASEKEQACAHERELARQRYEKLAEQEEVSSQQQRRRLFAELQAERDKMATQWEQQRRGVEQQQAELQETHARELAEARREHSEAMAEAERRHKSQLRAVEERLGAEREAWQENFTRKQETAFLAREREMRESLRQERDKEIEMVISRLEAETEVTRTQNEKAAETRIKRIREKCEAELSEVERSERSTQEKFTVAKQALGEREGEVARLRSLLQQKEEEVRQIGEVSSKLSRERDNVTDVVRQEFADRLVSTEEENRRLKIEMSELRARQRLELERGQREKEGELEEVHSRVRQALAKKEENLSALRGQHEAALKRAEHLEMLLERQRRELLKK